MGKFPYKYILNTLVIAYKGGLNMTEKRKCFICGKEYEYCPNCSNAGEQPWKFLYHDEKCVDISNIWYAYRGKEITKDEAKTKMSAIKPNIDDALKHNSVAANEIKEIFGIKEEKPEPKKTDVEKVEEKKPVENKGKQFNGYKK